VPSTASRFWPWWYRLLAHADPLIERLWRRTGMGNTVRAVFPGRRTGLPRQVFLGILRVDGVVYLGHPDVACAWTLNMDAAGGGELELRDGRRRRFTAELLRPGPERDAVVRATFRQHPFPGSFLYWLFRRHVGSDGRFYRLAPVGRRAGG
jgi:hypothetical protein